jgi:hypothetical protein
MKAVFTSFSSLLAIAVLLLSAQPAHSVAAAVNLTLAAFKSCDAAVSKHHTHEKLTIREGYTVDLFKIPSPSSKTIHIVVWIEDRPVNGDETPTITAVCVEKTAVSTASPKGAIDFHSGSKDKIYIRFHLENLQRSKWKKDTSTGFILANDSVMMQELKEGEIPSKPDLTQWPDCTKPKHVDVSDDPLNGRQDTEISFNFSRCSNLGTKNRVFEYRLVLDKYPANGGGGSPVDADIDPVIINRP